MKVDIEAHTVLSEVIANFSTEGMAFALQAEQLMAPQVLAVIELGRKVVEAQRSAEGETIQSLQKLGNRLKEMSQNMAIVVTGMSNAV